MYLNFIYLIVSYFRIYLKREVIAKAWRKWHHDRDLPQMYLRETIKFGSSRFQDGWKLFNLFCQCKDQNIKMYNLKVCLREKAFQRELGTISLKLRCEGGSLVFTVLW